MILGLYTIFTPAVRKREPGHGFLEGGFLRNKFYKGEILCRACFRACDTRRRRRGRDGAGGNGRASEEQQASGQH